MSLLQQNKKRRESGGEKNVTLEPVKPVKISK
jgi:hypothetical protein